MTQNRTKSDALFLLPAFELRMRIGQLPKQVLLVQAEVLTGRAMLTRREIRTFRDTHGSVPVIVENALYKWTAALVETERERHFRTQGMPLPAPTHFPDWPGVGELNGATAVSEFCHSDELGDVP